MSNPKIYIANLCYRIIFVITLPVINGHRLIFFFPEFGSALQSLDLLHSCVTSSTLPN